MRNNVKVKKRYLVTGGCGFVGRHLVDKLIGEGREIWIIDNLFTGRNPIQWLDSAFKKTSQKGSITLYKSKDCSIFFVNEDAVDVFAKELKGETLLPSFDDVFHLASIVGGRELIDGDPLLVAKDLAIDSYFFLWATRKKDKIKRILYASSSAAYPIQLQNKSDYVALGEELINFDAQVGLPDMTYGWSKLTGEYLSRLAFSRYGLSIACVRPFSGYGEDQDLSYPIPAIGQRVALRENPLTVWGTGRQGRDFVHIDDCIDAFFVILDNIQDGSGCNIGSGKILSFLEVLSIFSGIEGYKPKIEALTNKPVGVSFRYSDNSLISEMGWKPKISNEEGFSRVLIGAKNRVIGELISLALNNGKVSSQNSGASILKNSEFLKNLAYYNNGALKTSAKL